MAKEAKQPVAVRLSREEVAALEDLEAQWGCNRTDAVARSIMEAHVTMKAPRLVISAEETQAAMPPVVIMRETAAPSAPAPSVPLTVAQAQRQMLEKSAEKAGVCPDCGCAKDWCECPPKELGMGRF